MFDLVRVVGCPWSMGGWLGRTRAPVVFLDVPRVYPPHRLAPEGLGARDGSVGAVLRELPVPLRPREKLGGVRLRGRRRCRHPGRRRGRWDRVRAISHGRNRRPRALDDRARARGRRECRLESSERRRGRGRQIRRGTSHACSHEHRQGREDLRGVKRRPPGCPGVPTRAPHRVAGFARACSARRGTACPRVESVPETVTAGGRRRKRFGPE